VAICEAKQVTLRSLRNWKRLDPAEEVRPPGRPRLAQEVLDDTRREVVPELDRQGWGTGEGPIARALGLKVSRVRRVLTEVKAERRARLREHRQRARVSTVVHARDTLWAVDATHVGRDPDGAAVEGEVVREVASTRTIGLSVGPPATGQDVTRLLELTRRERGTAPLVLLSDNAAVYRSRPVKCWCAAHGVIRLYSRPHTPQHNGACEHGMRELKEDAQLGKGVIVHDTWAALDQLADSCVRIDGNRLRCTRGWQTAVEADLAACPWRSLVSREEVRREVACRIRRGLIHCRGKRARRRAVREAILDALHALGVITRIRDGRPWTAPFAESVS
jgi:transposase InsO family protein